MPPFTASDNASWASRKALARRPVRTYAERLMRPVAYVCIKDPSARARIIGVLERHNYVVIPQPTGFHLISSIADVIEGRESWREPTLIVVDALSPGCAGTTIADGLRDFGIRIPIEVVQSAADVEALALRIDERDRCADGNALAIDHVRAVAPTLHRRENVAVVRRESRRA